MAWMIKILNIFAFCCAVAAFLLIMALALGWSDRLMPLDVFNRAVSNLVAGYACAYGLAQWLQQVNRTIAAGMMAIGVLIIAANAISIR